MYAQYYKSTINFSAFLVAFWQIRTSTLFYILQMCMLIYILGYFDKTNFDTTLDYVMIFIVTILIYSVYNIFKWSHSFAVTKLIQINAANFKFKKVLDCSQDAICIINGSQLQMLYCNDVFVDLLHTQIRDYADAEDHQTFSSSSDL